MLMIFMFIYLRINTMFPLNIAISWRKRIWYIFCYIFFISASDESIFSKWKINICVYVASGDNEKTQRNILLLQLIEISNFPFTLFRSKNQICLILFSIYFQSPFGNTNKRKVVSLYFIWFVSFYFHMQFSQ